MREHSSYRWQGLLLLFVGAALAACGDALQPDPHAPISGGNNNDLPYLKPPSDAPPVDARPLADGPVQAPDPGPPPDLTLMHDVIDAEYSAALGEIIILASSPVDGLYALRPDSG